MKIAVAGGTGTVGRHIVAQAQADGHAVSVIARSTGVDLITGAGAQAAVDGADVVIDAASTGTLNAAASVEFFRRSSATLLSAARRAETPHVVVLSIVGIDDNPNGYYAGKVAQEHAYAESGLPWTLVRSTQFHEFAGQVAAQAAVGPIQLAPRARTQPIAAATVAAHLRELAAGAPAGRSEDIAGPREEQLSDMIRAWARHTGRRRPVLSVALPGAQMRGLRAGLALPGPGARLLGPTFAEWLSGQPAR